MKQQKSLAQDDKKKKRRKLLALILIPFGITGVVLGTVLPLTMCQNVVHVPPLKIDSSIDSKYLIANGQNVYFSSTVTTNHNTLLDLKAYADDCDYTGNDFIIDGIVDFGILVGFDQDINLYGDNSCLINIQGSQYSYGIAVGTAQLPGSNPQYTGNMYINSSVMVNIGASSNIYGVYFNTTVTGLININNIFNLKGTGHVRGIIFNNTIATGSTQNINGVFNIFTSNLQSYCQGIMFNGTIMPDSTQNINPILTISTSSGSQVNPVYYNNTSANDGLLTINGVFTCISAGATLSAVRLSSLISSIKINGVFALYNSSGIAATSGVASNFDITSLQGTPTFFSNKVDSGVWLSKGGTEKWNGTTYNSPTATTTADTVLTTKYIYDTGDAATANFSIGIIDTANGTNKNDYNAIYKTALLRYINNLSPDSNQYSWLTNIINQIPLS